MGQTARDGRQSLRNGRQTFESNLRVIGSGRQSVNGRGQAQNGRSIQHRDVELWDLDREDALQSEQKAAKRTRKPRQHGTMQRVQEPRQHGSAQRTQEPRQYRAVQRTQEPRQHRSAQRMEGPQQHRAVQRMQEPRHYRAGNPRPVQSIERRRAKRRRAYIYRAIALLVIILCLVLIYFMTGAIYRFIHKDTGRGIVQILSEQVTKEKIAPPEIVEDYLEINEYSRPGTELKKVNSIFVHYTANAGTTAEQNRSYFANLAETHERSASAHFIIGYDGTLLQCIPLDEQAYAVKTRNEDSISIECCYLAEDGSFTQETYDTLIHTLAWLIGEYHLSADDILRHYDCGGKLCPLYYAEHEDAWQQLREDVANYEDPGAVY